jgi:hypothetical protein
MLNRDIFNLIFKENAEFESPIYQSNLLFINKEIHNYYLNYLETIKEINVENGGVKGIKYLKNLEQLYIGIIGDNANINEINCLSKLHTLYFYNDQSITDKDFIKFNNLKNIKYLVLNGCYNIGNRSLGFIYNNMKNIEILNIKGTEITAKMLNNINRLDKLETLYIDNVSIASLKYLSKLDNLKSLDIHFSIKGMPDYQYFNYFIDFKSLKKLTYNSDVNYSIRLPAEYIKDMKILKFLELKEHTIDKDTIKYLMGNIDNILLYDCDIDIYTTRYILKHINRFKSFKIGVYNKKYNNKQLLIMNDINKSIDNFFIDIYNKAL